MSQNLFTSQDAVLPIFFPGVLYRMLKKEGVKHEQLLHGTRLNEQSFSSEELRISFVEMRQFLLNAISASGDPHLGWRFGKYINVTSLGMLGYAAMSCQTLRSSMETITHYFKIRDPLYELSLLEQVDGGEQSAIQIGESLDFGELRYFFLSSAVSGTAHLQAYYSSHADIISHASLACSRPKGWMKIEGSIPFPITFDAPYTRVFFASYFLDQALPTANLQTEKSTKDICEQLLSRIETKSGVVGQIRDYIFQQAGQYPSLKCTAENFCISPRTLRRELQKSETTYQAILDKVRETIAVEYLQTTDKAIYEIAIELGFNDVSNFGRAFKRWTGKAPSTYRKRESI